MPLCATMFKMVSDEDMQDLWASILAGEADKPGSFSKSTVEAVSRMGKEDARMFADFCQFAWTLVIDGFGIDQKEIVPLLYDRRNDYEWPGEVDKGHRSMYSIAKHLDYLRLISFDGGGYTRVFSFPFYSWDYHGTRIHIRAPQKNYTNLPVNMGYAMFTEAGEQLYRICGAQKDDDAFQYVLGKWQELGYNPHTRLPDADKKGRE